MQWNRSLALEYIQKIPRDKTEPGAAEQVVVGVAFILIVGLILISYCSTSSGFRFWLPF